MIASLVYLAAVLAAVLAIALPLASDLKDLISARRERRRLKIREHQIRRESLSLPDHPVAFAVQLSHEARAERSDRRRRAAAAVLGGVAAFLLCWLVAILAAAA